MSDPTIPRPTYEATTKDLVEELRGRTGVEVTTLAPSATATIRVEGPAIVLSVID